MKATAAQSLWRVDTDSATLLLAVIDGLLETAYLGSRIADDTDLSSLVAASRPVVPHGELDQSPVQSAFPTRDGRPQLMPALVLRRAGSELTTELRVTRGDQGPEGLTIELEDTTAAVGLTLEASPQPGGAVQLTSTLHNRGEDPLEVDWLASAHLPLEPELTFVRSFGGFWANEFQARDTPLGDATQYWGSDRGRSSHGSAATLIAMGDASGEEQGPTLLLSLHWPGNHSLCAGPTREGGHALQGGLRLTPGELQLAGGESFTTPSALVAWSEQGLNGLRRQLQRSWAATRRPGPRPVHLNSWEACYFDHDEARTLALIAAAADIGAERFILDDGWMAGRTGPGVGLGDWRPCPQRYPRGLAPIAAAARAAGLEFGLWIEPEMVTLDSDLARDHPDWIIGAPGREAIAGRGQFLLDTGREDVRAHLAAVLDRIVRDCTPDYIKWDMNRDYAHVGPASGSTALGMTRGWMSLVEQFRARHPQVTVELCGAGGARSDGGAMRLADRLWPSDSIDAVQRFSVLRHASLLLPPARLGWHIGAGTAHTSGATYPASTRCILALLGHPGLELDPVNLDSDERREVQQWLRFYKANRDWLENADLFYLDAQPGHAEALLLHADDATRALLFLVQTTYPASGAPGRLKLKALERRRNWHVTLLNPQDAGFAQTLPDWLGREGMVLPGEVLRRVGLRPPPLRLGHCALIALDACA